MSSDRNNRIHKRVKSMSQHTTHARTLSLLDVGSDARKAVHEGTLETRGLLLRLPVVGHDRLHQDRLKGHLWMFSSTARHSGNNNSANVVALPKLWDGRSRRV